MSNTSPPKTSPISGSQPETGSSQFAQAPTPNRNVIEWLRDIVAPKTDLSDEGLRDTINDYIDEMSSSAVSSDAAVSHELELLKNILNLHELKAEDVMVPRADIVALEVSSPPEDLLNILAHKYHDRVPVYRETLDDIIGVIHHDDVLSALILKKDINIKSMMREAQVVSPAMPVFDLLLMMRDTDHQMVFVVDEYGGIDGLVTIGDVVAAMIGEMKDQAANTSAPLIIPEDGQSYIVDGRILINEFEAEFGQILTDDDRMVADTLAGFIFAIAGRVPARGEVIEHKPTKLVFEIMEADPRRVTRIRVTPPQPLHLHEQPPLPSV